MSSSASAASSTVDPFSSADESSNHATLSQPPSEATTPTPLGGNKSFQFPKTKKVKNKVCRHNIGCKHSSSKLSCVNVNNLLTFGLAASDEGMVVRERTRSNEASVNQD